MADLTHLLRKARRREFADMAIRRAGWGLAIGASVAMTSLLVQRGFDLRFSPLVFSLVPLIGLIGGILHARMTRPPSLQTAVNLDRSLRLKDRIGSAHEMSARSGLHIDGGFSALLQADASRLAETIDIRPATPIRITGVWGTALVLCLLLWIGTAYLPTVKWRSTTTSHHPSPEQVAQLQPQAQQVAQAIEQSTRELPANDPALDPKTREDLAALERLSQQLTQPPGSQQQIDSARDEAAARMNELADRLAEQSERDLSAADELAQKFSGMDATGAPRPPMSAEEFRNALQRGDFGAAAKELEDLLKKPEAMTPEEQQALADHLRDTADRLNNESTSDEQKSSARQEQFEQSLRDQGFTQKQIDQLRELMKESPQAPEELQRAIEQQNFDPDTAEQLARDLNEMLDKQRTDEQVRRDMENVGESLDEAAEQIENPPSRTPDDGDATRQADHERSSTPTTQPAAQPPASQPLEETAQPSAPQEQSNAPPPSLEGQPPRSGQPQDEKSSPPQTQDRKQQGQDRQQSTSQPSSEQQQRQEPQKESPSSDSQPQSQPDQRASPQQPPRESQEQRDTRREESASPQRQQSPRQPTTTPETPQSHPQVAKPTDSQQKEAAREQPQTRPDPTQSQKQQQQTPQQQPETRPDAAPQETQTPQSSAQQRQQDRQPQQPNESEQRQQPDRPQTGQPDRQPQAEKTPSNDQRPDQPGQPKPADASEEQKQGLQRDSNAAPQDKPSNSPAEALRRIAERRNAAKDRQQISEDMRRRARELAERMSPEERERWAREWQKQNPHPSSDEQPKLTPSPSADDSDQQLVQGGRDAGRRNGTADSSTAPTPIKDSKPDTVDLRGNDPGEQMLSDFLEADPNTPASDSQPRRTSGEVTERVRQAREVAERAVNDSAVPSRYHQFIRRVFGNLDKTVPAAPPTTQSGG